MPRLTMSSLHPFQNTGQPPESHQSSQRLLPADENSLTRCLGKKETRSAEETSLFLDDVSHPSQQPRHTLHQIQSSVDDLFDEDRTTAVAADMNTQIHKGADKQHSATRRVRPGNARVHHVKEICANTDRAEEEEEEEVELLISEAVDASDGASAVQQTHRQENILTLVPPPSLSFSLPGGPVGQQQHWHGGDAHCLPSAAALQADTPSAEQNAGESPTSNAAAVSTASLEQTQRVQVWVPRRIELLVCGESSATTRLLPQAVVWRSTNAVTATASLQHAERYTEHSSGDVSEGNRMNASLRGALLVPSPLSSPAEWRVSAFECVEMHLPSSMVPLAPTEQPSNKKSDPLPSQTGGYVSAACTYAGGLRNARSSSSSGSDSEDETGAALPSHKTATDAVITRVSVRRLLSTARDSRRERAGVYDTDAEDEEAERGAALTRGVCGRHRRRRSREEDADAEGADERRDSRRSSSSSRVRRRERVCAPPASALHRGCAVMATNPRAAVEVRLTLPWLLHASVLPPAAAASLRSCLEAYITAAVGKTGGGRGAQGNAESTAATEHALPPPFWISVFAYSHAIQTRVTTFAAGVVHEVEMTAASHPGKAALECVAWPAWVPDVQWSLQVLTALTSAAFVLIGDIAAALRTATTNTDAAVTESSASPLFAVQRRLDEFHRFTEAVFGDAENKKLCHFVRDRLPLHLNDLSALLSRPVCCSNATSSGASQCMKGSTTITSPPSPTRYPSVLDVVHALALAWMRECFPALSSRLHSFLTTRDPGVVLDALRALPETEHAERGASSTTSLHDEVYACAHDFVHGVLHRWHYWSAATTLSASTAGHEHFFMEVARTSGSALQWAAHVNYAKMQLLQWLMLPTIFPSAVSSSETTKKDSCQRSERVVQHAAPTSTDMQCVLELLSLLPVLVESSVLPHEVESGLRRACAAMPLHDLTTAFHAAFRVIFTACCYRATMLTDEAVAVVLGAFCVSGNSDGGGGGGGVAPHTSSRSSMRIAACFPDEEKAEELSSPSSSLLSSTLEAARSVWQAWILPVMVSYNDVCSHGVGQSRESVVAAAASANHTAQDSADSDVDVSDPPQLRLLLMAERVLNYALALLQLVREGQRQSLPSSSLASRKRHRHASAETARQRFRPLYRPLSSSEGPRQQRQVWKERAGGKEDEKEKEWESSSLCSPFSESSYATASTATTSIAAATAPAPPPVLRSLPLNCSRTTTKAPLDKPPVSVKTEPSLRTPCSVSHAAAVAAPLPASALPPPREYCASCPSVLNDGCAPRGDWRETCRTAVRQWLARTAHLNSDITSSFNFSDGAATSPSAAASVAAPLRGGHVVHRRDVRRTRAFLLCLRYCVHEVLQRTQEEVEEYAAKEEEEEGLGSVGGVTGASAAQRYDFLYGVLPPGLRDGDGALGVYELPASPAAPPPQRRHRDRCGRCTVSCDTDGENLHMTSTDSLSLDSVPAVEGDGVHDDDLSHLPSSSTTLLSSLSVSTSPSTSSPES